MSQEALAERSSVALRTIGNIESGHTVPQEGKLRLILDALDLPADLKHAKRIIDADPGGGDTPSPQEMRAAARTLLALADERETSIEVEWTEEARAALEAIVALPTQPAEAAVDEGA